MDTILSTATALALAGTAMAAKAAVILTVGLVALAGLTRTRAAVRHAVAAASLAGALAVPVFSALLPSLRAPIPSVASVRVQTTATASTNASAALAAVNGDAFTSSTPAATRVSAPRPWGAMLLLGAMFAWMLGVLAVAVRVVLGVVSTRRLIDEAERCDDVWQSAARRVRERIGVAHDVAVLRHSSLAVPITARVLRPVIIVPESAGSWSNERRELVLAHELAHVRRRDCLADFLAWAACAAYWFLPMTWRLATRLRVERERACDDAVLALGTPAHDYADHLADLAWDARTARAIAWQAAALAMAPVGPLEARVRDILAPHRRRGAMTRAMRATVLSAGIAVVVPISIIAPRASATRSLAARMPRDTLDIPIGLSETVRWTGAIASGATISVRANMGDILIDSIAGSSVEVVAQRRAGAFSQPADTRLSIVRDEAGLSVCSVYVDPARGRSPCDADGEWGRTSVENNEVSLRVRVPAGVHVRIQAGNGDVRASAIHGNVFVLNGNGDANIASDGAADITTYTGALAFTRLRGGAGGPIALHVLHGEISAQLPHGADVDALADTGVVRVSAPGLADAPVAARYRGALLDARTPLVARIQKGTIDIAVRP